MVLMGDRLGYFIGAVRAGKKLIPNKVYRPKQGSLICEARRFHHDGNSMVISDLRFSANLYCPLQISGERPLTSTVHEQFQYYVKVSFAFEMRSKLLETN